MHIQEQKVYKVYNVGEKYLLVLYLLFHLPSGAIYAENIGQIFGFVLIFPPEKAGAIF